MQIGIIGLGKMGGNIACRLMAKGHETVVFDRSSAAIEGIVKQGAVGAESVPALVEKLRKPCAVWLMLPEGEPTEGMVLELGKLLAADDVIIDGGNSFYKDDMRRAVELSKQAIHYLDVGTSGGVWGLERGYCMMIGGDGDVVARLEPIFEALAPGRGSIERTAGRTGDEDRAERGYSHTGPVGSGHFVKMIHNGIEYGLMQAYAEGFEILKAKASETLPAGERFNLDLAEIAEVWRRGSVISSWLLDLTAQALVQDVTLDHYAGAVADSGEGRWTVQAAIEQAVPTPVLANALFARFRSREENSYSDRLLSAMRFGFGGHVEKGAK